MILPRPGPAETRAFIVEHYWPGITPARFRPTAERLRRGVDAAAARGAAVRLLHSTVVTQDETVFCVFEAESQETVRQVYTSAGVRFERLLDAVDITTTEDQR